MRKIGLLILVALLIPLALSAARLTLRDGTVVYGQFLNSSFGKIDIQDSRGMRRTFDVRQIREIDFRSSDSSADRYFPGDPIPGARPPRQPAFDSTPPGRDETRYGRTWTTLFPGTVLSIRTSETIDARGTAESHIYPATIAQDVVDGSGSLVIPRGSEAALLVRKIDEGGALALDLDWVRVNGRRYYVDTSNLRTGSHDDNVGANRRTAVMAGGGAALGALAGALAAGGQGAAIGAAAGAAAGTGVQVLTRGREIRVPAETVLNFRLEDPLQLREAR